MGLYFTKTKALAPFAYKPTINHEDEIPYFIVVTPITNHFRDYAPDLEKYTAVQISPV